MSGKRQLDPIDVDLADRLLRHHTEGVPISRLAQQHGTSWNRVSEALQSARLRLPETRPIGRPIPGECLTCTCYARPTDFEIEPLTSRLIRKAGTCRAVRKLDSGVSVRPTPTGGA